MRDIIIEVVGDAGHLVRAKAGTGGIIAHEGVGGEAYGRIRCSPPGWGWRIEQADWGVATYLREGHIVFRANYYERRGVDHGRACVLAGGVNLVDETLQEQGTIKNEWFLAGAGSGWGVDNRLYATVKDTDSEARYGLRQGGEVRVDVSVQGTLDSQAVGMLEESREPRGIVDLAALDLAPARWWQYDVGDTVWLEIYDDESACNGR